MFDFSPVKILLIVVVTAVLLGPDKLPEVAKTLGSFWRQLKGLQSKIEGEVRDIIPDLPNSANLAKYARSPLHLLNELAERSDASDGVSEDASVSGAVESPEPSMLTARKPMVNPVAQPLDVTTPFDPSLN